jgi:hypothetical protein
MGGQSPFWMGHFLLCNVTRRSGICPKSGWGFPGVHGLMPDVRKGSQAVKLTVSTCSPNFLTYRTFGKPLHCSRTQSVPPESALSLRARPKSLHSLFVGSTATAFETHNGRSALAAGIGLHAP